MTEPERQVEGRRWTLISDKPQQHRVNGPDCPYYVEVMPVSEAQAQIDEEMLHTAQAVEIGEDQRFRAQAAEKEAEGYREATTDLRRAAVFAIDHGFHSGECLVATNDSCTCGWAEARRGLNDAALALNLQSQEGDDG